MKTKFLNLLLIMLFLSLASCIKSPATISETESLAASSSPISAVEPTRPINFTEIKASRSWRIAFIPKFKFLGKTGKLSSYWQPAWYGAQKAGVDFGVQVELVTADTLGDTDADYIEPQIRLVADLISRGNINGLVIAPFDSNRLAPVVEKAIAAGIPVVAMDTPVNSDQLVTFVAFDNFSGGKTVGEWVVQQLSGKGKVLILDGPQDQQNAIDRRNGFLAGLKSADIEVLNTKPADWEIEPARQITAEWLKQYKDVNAIMAANDNMALGAAQAIADAKRQKILVTGFDATDAALKAIAANQISATIDQTPGDQARLAILILVRYLEFGETFPSRIFLPHILLITKENVDAYLSERGLK